MSLYFSVLIFHIQCCVCVWISIGFQQLVFLVFFQLVIRVTFVCLLEEPSGSCPHTCESRSELCFWLTYTHIHTQTHTHSDALPTHLHTLQIFKPQWLPETANIWHLTWVYVCEDSHHFSVTKSLKHTSQWYMHLLTEPTHMKKKTLYDSYTATIYLPYLIGQKYLLCFIQVQYIYKIRPIMATFIWKSTHTTCRGFLGHIWILHIILYTFYMTTVCKGVWY